jgi:hypothetical protein
MSVGAGGKVPTRIASIGINVSMCGLLSASVGCAAVDATLSPRGHNVNLVAGNLRDNNVLVNIVRASHDEPLDFITIAKYTATGSLGLTSNLLTRVFPGPVGTVGPNNLAAMAGNTIDLGTLENNGFYSQFMSPVPVGIVHLLLHSGLSRPIVFHALLDAIKINLPNGDSFRFENDPNNDKWTYAGGAVEERSHECEDRSKPKPGIGSAFNSPFAWSVWKNGVREDLWRGAHKNGCNYQKFLYWLRVAFSYGVTTEEVSVPNPAAKMDKSPVSNSVTNTNTSQLATIPPARVCFDPALGRKSISEYPLPSLLCGPKTKPSGGQFPVAGGTAIKAFVPEFRSPYAVFGYFGHLIAYDTVDRVKLDAGLREAGFDIPSLHWRDGPRILTVDGTPPCFARINYEGRDYCVPSENANNTKEIFTLLNALVALSILQTALPVTQSVIVQP